MAKKKKPCQGRPIAEHSTPQAVEIDYERLADAIVEANKKAKSAESGRTASRELMKFILMPILYAVAFLCAVAAVGFVLVAIQSVQNTAFSGTDALLRFSLAFMLCLVMIALSLFTFFAAREVSDETDRDYIAALFSNVVSFAALIIALVALLREVV